VQKIFDTHNSRTLCIFKFELKPQEWHQSYIQSYIERDVRQIKNVQNLGLFQKFLKLCAGRTGQILNLSSLANDCGITHNTAQAWISLLESSFILFLLRPYHENFGKQVIKSPKLYFYDTGVLCSLLQIDSPSHLFSHYLKGSIFENFVIVDLIKMYRNLGKNPPLYFWHDKLGREIDCLIKKADMVVPVEIKVGQTINRDFFKNLNYWQSLQTQKSPSFVVYGGDESQIRTNCSILSWRNISCLLH
jgi:predicted AAA+ superfamily ATPase